MLKLQKHKTKFYLFIDTIIYYLKDDFFLYLFSALSRHICQSETSTSPVPGNPQAFELLRLKFPLHASPI